ncbi:phage tail sheath C-terminal domain-containing protein [Streptomyces sp. NPDC002265]|uniref:phage tail sheath family protein n=1 Tax=Streptomyces sp. NPDC002265 TaxID=3154415 RepID=UPI003327769B
MPVNTTYPGVYIDEVKSGVRTITGVPTSIAAFVGYAPRGPVDRPVHITGWADYQSNFGGLHPESAMSYAVYQFYLNGGSEAEIVRVVGDSPLVDVPVGRSQGAGGRVRALGPTPESGEEPGESPAVADTRTASPGPLSLKAANPGSWARSLRTRVDYDTSEEKTTSDHERTLYNLTIRDTGTGAEERYLNVSIDKDSPRNLSHLLTASRLVQAPIRPVQELPGKNDEPKTQGADPFADPEPTRDGQPPATYSKPEDGGGQDDVKPTLASYTSGEVEKEGIFQLRKSDIFNLLCLPGCHDELDGSAAQELQAQALRLCIERRAVLLVDPPPAWCRPEGGGPLSVDMVANPPVPPEGLLAAGDDTKNAALYFPRVIAPDPLREGALRAFPPCGVMAGVLARTDLQRGVWKAAAGTDASLNGVSDLEVLLSDLDNGRLNPLGINCLRRLPAVGPVVWGARTMRGADRLADEWKYLPVRRLALFVEESLFRGTQWVVFEPNDEPLWASIRLNIGAFMNSLFRAGAFQGRTPQEAYLVKCDRENNPQNDIDRGIVNVQVGFAPLKPAEFVIVHIQQLAGQTQV